MVFITSISSPATAPSCAKAFKASKLYPANGCVSGVSSILRRGPKSLCSMKGGVRSNRLGDVSAAIATQPGDAILALGTLAVEASTPAKGFSYIPEAIGDIRQGKMVVVVDDENRENEGDLVMAAAKVTPEAMAFFVKHGIGIVCVSMKEDDLERLELPLMVESMDNEEKLCTAFTVTVDRATTILGLASKDSKPGDFNRPGLIFPLKYREGGVLKRPGHTEPSVDLAVLAGFDPVAVIVENVDDDDGSMARLPKLLQFARLHDLQIISIADLVIYLMPPN